MLFSIYRKHLRIQKSKKSTILKLLKQFPSIKWKIKTNLAFLPKVAREFLIALAGVARLM
jgi:hypothetical protein